MKTKTLFSMGGLFRDDQKGYSLVEVATVLAGAVIILAMGIPMINTVTDHYEVLLAAQNVASQMQYARMKAVASNEPFSVRINTNSFQVETSDGTPHGVPYSFPPGVVLNTADSGDPVSFPGDMVTFLPTGNLPDTGAGSAGRLKLINQSQVRVDIVVDAGGMVRQTPAFKTASPPF